MYGKVVGLGPVIRGTSKKTGKPFLGQTLHLTFKKRGVEGTAVKTQYVDFQNMDSPPAIKLGDEVFLDYDDSGYLLEFDMVSPEK